MSGRNDKIAVVLIHGIGDQRPMATLRGFVETLLQPDPNAPKRPLYWSKPDALSQSFELRRYHAPAGRKRPPIDFYEYYWANKMDGNALSHFVQWINNLLLRMPGAVPPALRNLWWLCWGLAAVVLAMTIMLWGWTPVGAFGAMIVLLAGAAKIVVQFALRDWIGDAARYFDDRPTNIGVRDTIRRGGVELLEKVHDSGEYHRVIVVGHSLGSAIALDILYHYWSRVRERHGGVDKPGQTALSKLETVLKTAGVTRTADWRAMQKDVWNEMRANGCPWRVTDLVTLGSPLAHLPFLTRLDADSFQQRLVQRELPTCPPVLDGKGIAYWTRYHTAAGASRSIATLHHAACFAPMRWTNIYFEHNGWFGGDPVGGPLRPLFGDAIEDRKVSTRHWKGQLNHLDYWRDDPRDAGRADAPLPNLRESLALNEGGWTRRDAAARPKGPAAATLPPVGTAPPPTPPA